MTRQSGWTTEQMLAAPHGSIYIWPVHRTLAYAKSLAQHIGRVDLCIAPLGWLASPSNTTGCRSPVVVDHAAVDALRYGSMEHTGWCALRDRGRVVTT